MDDMLISLQSSVVFAKSADSRYLLFLAVLFIYAFAFVLVALLKGFNRRYIDPTLMSTKRLDEVELEAVVIDPIKIDAVTENCTECLICLESLENNKLEEAGCKWILRQCGHKFHGQCLADWLYHGQPNCPVCRRVVPPLLRFPLLPLDVIAVEV